MKWRNACWEMRQRPSQITNTDWIITNTSLLTHRVHFCRVLTNTWYTMCSRKKAHFRDPFLAALTLRLVLSSTRARICFFLFTVVPVEQVCRWTSPPQLDMWMWEGKNHTGSQVSSCFLDSFSYASSAHSGDVWKWDTSESWRGTDEEKEGLECRMEPEKRIEIHHLSSHRVGHIQGAWGVHVEHVSCTNRAHEGHISGIHRYTILLLINNIMTHNPLCSAPGWDEVMEVFNSNETA